MNKLLLLGLAILSSTFSLTAQEKEESDNPVEDEFTTIIENSNDYQGYKVVDYSDLMKLKQNTANFISNLNNEIVAQKNTIDQQQKEIVQLRKDLENTRDNLKEVTAEKDAITFLGMPFSKGSYMALMWGIVAILILLLLFFIYKYKKGHAQTSEAKNNLTETEKEFEAFKAKALVKEQRLGRLLQDERNKASDK
ncbi:hypothetical protein JM83_0296 [Gillisia sp. Hel_I_86]|uniref:hypothetical protein n=1 Tax=Gillisia sp. Hel_I_86 TaxID=1249981 RepID=UPI00119AAE66|nr:hypothetical protein [Gillisia sp. Hel_I_86]TVZ25390.1 hypothetical protein JM83_0296 [Gillisia sp. Hel_I_86]